MGGSYLLLDRFSTSRSLRNDSSRIASFDISRQSDQPQASSGGPKASTISSVRRR